MPERRVVPIISLDESQDLLFLRAGLPGSEMARLVIVQRPLLSRLSNCSRASLPKHREQRRVCIIFGALKDDFRSIRVSCAGSRLKPADGSSEFGASRAKSVVE